MSYYDDLGSADGLYGRSRGHRWKVDWDITQPIQVQLTWSPGVEDKIPGDEGIEIKRTTVGWRLVTDKAGWSILQYRDAI